MRSPSFTPTSPYTSKLFYRIPAKVFAPPSSVWRSNVPSRDQANPAKAKEFLADLQRLSEAGALEQKAQAVDQRLYTTYRRVKSVNFTPHGWQPPAATEQEAQMRAHEYHRRLALKYPVVRCVNGAWVKVGEVCYAAA